MTTYIIAEIGQNHNGSLEMARRLIDMACAPPVDRFSGKQLPRVDAVKFTKRDLQWELTQSQFHEPYDSPHAFGRTYGEHREALELSDDDHAALYAYAKSKGVDFIETVCAPTCLAMLDRFRPDHLKVASRDLTNLPLLDALSETGIPIILSTGMSGESELRQAVEVIERRHRKITILHCVSEYPAQYANINLRRITRMKQAYPDYRIGYSDHSIGIVIPTAAVAMGAEVIEKHITLDREMKGSDHWGALARDGLRRMVRDIRNLEFAFGREDLTPVPASARSQRKLERSIASRHDLPAGHVITEEDLCLLSPGTGLRWSARDQVIGRRTRAAIAGMELIDLELLE